jgi:hypothetical protein
MPTLRSQQKRKETNLLVTDSLGCTGDGDGHGQ